ncbi:MAG: hypothetical protein ACREAW_02985 [Nitrososphaera sp.]
MTRKMANDSTDNSANVDGQIAYHEEMESLAYRAGDYTKAEHHRKMKEICKAMLLEFYGITSYILLCNFDDK